MTDFEIAPMPRSAGPIVVTCWRCRAEYDYLAEDAGSLTHCAACQRDGYGPTPEQAPKGIPTTTPTPTCDRLAETDSAGLAQEKHSSGMQRERGRGHDDRIRPE